MKDNEVRRRKPPDLIRVEDSVTFAQAFFGPRGWRKSLRRYLILAGPFSVGIITLVVLLMEPLSHFWRSVALSLVIGQVCLAACYWGSHLVTMGERLVFQKRGWTHTERTGLANTLRGVMFMLPALWLSYQIVGRIAPLIGVRWDPPEFADYRYGMIFGLVSTLVHVAWELHRGKKDSDKAIQDLESANLKAQVAALTAQMNPHLLFNSLNSIASMIHENPDSAEAMTVELSSLYRRVLAASKQETHSLAAELGLCRSYLEIEKARFGDRLKYEIVVGTAVDADAVLVPVLCVQPFVENAVKHGLLTQVAGGNLKVTASAVGDKLKVLVVDDGVGYGKAPASKGTGTAIANCRERLRMMFPEQASLEIEAANPGTRVVLQMPLGRGGKA